MNEQDKTIAKDLEGTGHFVSQAMSIDCGLN